MKDFFRYDLPRGLHNLWRWAPIIWSDVDWDWTAIARVLEFKLLKHAEYEEKRGHHTTSKRDARNMRICATLLRRLQDDKYYEEAKKRFWHSRHAVEHASNQGRADQRYLGLLLGKYLTHWWD